MISGKSLLDSTNLFSSSDYQKMTSTLKTNMAKENVGLDFRLKEIYETRNYLLVDIKHK